jgi:hypothetical protein
MIHEYVAHQTENGRNKLCLLKRMVNMTSNGMEKIACPYDLDFVRSQISDCI